MLLPTYILFLPYFRVLTLIYVFSLTLRELNIAQIIFSIEILLFILVSILKTRVLTFPIHYNVMARQLGVWTLLIDICFQYKHKPTGYQKTNLRLNIDLDWILQCIDNGNPLIISGCRISVKHCIFIIKIVTICSIAVDFKN